MPILRHAAVASESEQSERIADMSADSYHLVGALRLAFIGITSFHRQLADIVSSDKPEESTGLLGVSEGSAPPLPRDLQVLFAGCAGLLRVADRLMLHMEDMWGEPWVDTWERVKPILEGDPDIPFLALAVECLLKCFNEVRLTDPPLPNGWGIKEGDLASTMLRTFLDTEEWEPWRVRKLFIVYSAMVPCRFIGMNSSFIQSSGGPVLKGWGVPFLD